MFGFGLMELLLILIIVLIIFGVGRLPQLGEGIGKAISGFKKSVRDAKAEEAQPHAESRPTVSEIIENNGAPPDRDAFPPPRKDSIGGKEKQRLSRQGQIT